MAIASSLIWFSMLLGASIPSYAAESLAQQELDCLLGPHVKVNIGAAVAGLISGVMVDRGDVVKAGQVVATLESGVEEANVALARAKANNDLQVHSNQARADFLRRKASRHEQLRLTNATPEATFDEAETDAKMAQFATQDASLNLEAQSSKAVGVNPIDPHELVRSLQSELKRLGCFSGPVDGELNDATRAAERMLAKFSSIKIPDALTLDTIKTLSGISNQICPLVCRDGVRSAGGRCINRTVASGGAARSNAAKTKSKHRETTNFEPSHRSAN